MRRTGYLSAAFIKEKRFMDILERFLTFAENSPTAFHAAANLAVEFLEDVTRSVVTPILAETSAASTPA